ncbi:hypothetical protein HWV23_12630 [Natronomonas halophila]|uniref:hypothetical protein n=1 Tax=Natronomonas halophila TaxID=2747817 RepID=UPI0015B5E09A|nr:hypothetical protein [Natronomonas halophila]QLD86537.1 hypothetical protein HWV23_12630 [Natronomonas halophila]
METTSEVVSRLRQPEYTGENRCIPCTVTNIVIAVVLTGVLAFVSPPLAGVFAVLAAGSIWLRGYLVPKTPELTKRYFPEWLLAKFDKAPEPTPEPPSDFNPEEVLLEAGAVEPCADVDDLCLTDDFETAWLGRIEALEDEDALRDELADQLDLERETIDFETYGDAFIAHSDGEQIGQWESRAALLADLAAAKELPDWIDYWSSLPSQHRSQLLGGLRVFITDCPTCGGPVTTDTEVVESCCRSTTVVAVACEDCGDRLLEVPHQEPA